MDGHEPYSESARPAAATSSLAYTSGSGLELQHVHNSQVKNVLTLLSVLNRIAANASSPADAIREKPQPEPQLEPGQVLG